MSHNQTDFSTTQTCDPEAEFVRSDVTGPDEDAPTKAIDDPQEYKQVVVVYSDKSTVELDYDVRTDREIQMRTRIAALLKQ